MEKGRRSEGSACPCEGGLPQTQDEGTAAGQATPEATDGKQCRVFRPFKSRHQSASKKDGTSLLSHQENTRMSFWSSPPPQHGSSSQFDKGKKNNRKKLAASLFHSPLRSCGTPSSGGEAGAVLGGGGFCLGAQQKQKWGGMKVWILQGWARGEARWSLDAASQDVLVLS